MSTPTLVASAWTRHAEAPEAVFAELTSHAAEVPAAAAGPFLVVLLHVGCEHLSRDEEVARVVSELSARLPGTPVIGAAEVALRSVALGRWVGDPGSAEEAWALAAVLGIAGARGAQELARQAVTRAERVPSQGDATRRLAVATNNLACALEERAASLGPDGRQALRTAAVVARATWERAGTWLEVERAEYRLAMTHLVLGEPAAAITHAETCLAICQGNAAPPLECVYAWEAIARAASAGGAERRAREALAWARAMVDAPDFPADQRGAARELLDRAAARVA